MLKGPGQGHHVRSRQNGAEPNQHHDPNRQQHYPQQQSGQYSQAQLYPAVDQSPIQYLTYRGDEPLIRSPSINMDWQTLRVPR